jgi:hypothetical protein
LEDGKGQRAVIEGSLPDVEQTRPDVATWHDRDAPPQPADEPAPAAKPENRAQKRRRNRGLVRTLLKRLWIPLIVVIVLAAGGLAVSRLHGIFGSEKPLSYGDTKKDTGAPYNPKKMKYEVFGTPGTSAQVSYFDVNGDPHHEDVTLPWSTEFPISAAAGIGSIAAQADGDTVGCRISIDGVVKAENTTTHEVSSFTSCLLKGA